LGLTLAKIEEVAPDQGSLAAAKKLLKLSNWPAIAQNGSGLIWGECQGSGATPYRISVTEADAGYKCSCPSRKFPCKHALALMWMRVEGKVDFAIGTAPDWVNDWLSRRRGPSAVAPTATADKPKASIADIEETEVVTDPRAEARAAATRERSRLEREASIAGALDELDTWLVDQMDGGLAAFPTKASSACRVMAQRLFDAKASGLALRVDGMPARLFAFPEAERPIAAVRELGTLHLAAQAYRRQDHLSEPLRHDIRQLIGWNLTREALLADRNALHVSGIWRVWAIRNEVQPDKLRRIETWLQGSDQQAVLIEYVPVSTGASSSGYSVGDTFEAELVFYPSSVPLRAFIAGQITGANSSDAPLALPVQDLSASYGLYEEALIKKPWLGEYPLMFRGARVKRWGDDIYLSDNEISLPLAKSQSTATWPLLQLEAIDGAALWDGNELTLCWSETALGRWTA
jgi:hypothetical protein